MFATIQKRLLSRIAISDQHILSALDLDNMETLRHSRKRHLTDHLVSTRRILAAWDQPPFIQLAGLCHSIYSTEAFKPQAIQITDRARVESLIGTKAERLVYLFSSVLRRPLFDMIKTASSLRAQDKITVTSRSDFETTETEISGSEAAQLLIVHLANMAEQSSDESGRPTIWVAYFTHLAFNLSKSAEHVPPVFASCRQGLSRRGELGFRSSYSSGTAGMMTSPERARQHFLRCVDLCYEIPEPHIWLAYIACKEGVKGATVSHARVALESLARWGTSWDKRLEFIYWRNIAQDLLKGSMDEAHKLLPPISSSEQERAIITNITPLQVNQSTVDNPAGMNRFMLYLNRMSQDRSRASVCIYPGLSSKEVHEASDFSVIPDLETSFEQIRDEVDRMDVSKFQTEAEKIGRRGSWKVFMLYESGRKNESNCQQCPSIVRILEKHSCVRKTGGLIYLSRLAADTHVAAHQGPTNLRVRCHFPLRVPDGDCGMRVGEKILRWEEGKCLVFDDHFEHEVWNRTNKDRVVLLIDMWHPELSKEEQNALEALQWYAFQHAVGIHRYWRLNEEQGAKEGIIVGSTVEEILPIEDH